MQKDICKLKCNKKYRAGSIRFLSNLTPFSKTRGKSCLRRRFAAWERLLCAAPMPKYGKYGEVWELLREATEREEVEEPAREPANSNGARIRANARSDECLSPNDGEV